MSNLSIAQSEGVLSGTVVDAETNEPLIGVTITLDGTTGTYSDPDGKFLLSKVSPGKHQLVFSYIGYKKDTIADIVVTQGKATIITHKLPAEGFSLKEEVKIVAERTTTTTSEVSIISEMKTVRGVVSGISAEQIVRTQDRDAGEVVRRMPGITLSDSRFVMVRGLNERYNTVMLNGVITPSSETDTRAFSFDLVPSSLIDKLLIYKAPTPDLPGEFSGGLIKIFTKNIPEKNQVFGGYSTSYRSGTTGQEFFSTEGSSTDWLGFDNGKRNLPEAAQDVNLSQINDPIKVSEIAKQFPNDWGLQSGTAIPDQRFTLGFALRKNVGIVNFGSITNLNYSNTKTSIIADRYNYNSYDLRQQRSDTVFVYQDKQYETNIRVGALQNFSVRIGENHKLEWRNLLNQYASNQTILRSGKNIEEANDELNRAYRFQARSIFSSQLNGIHQWADNKHGIDWVAGYSYALQEDPNFRRLRTAREINSEQSVPYVIRLSFGPDVQNAGRYYATTREFIRTGSLNYTFQLDNLKLKTGGFYENRNRIFQARWMSIISQNQTPQSWFTLSPEDLFAPERFVPNTGLSIAEGTNPSDSYTAANELLAGYVMGEYQLGKINLTGGVRYENNLQSLNSSTLQGVRKIELRNRVVVFLPSLNFSYKLTESTQLRLAYGMTVNRPE
ncbi:MAG: TonB-dependent receptor, partial [Bacteroidia bacterium]|nr:TonB-dependent receptor [Bacteroidia bacterium]